MEEFKNIFGKPQFFPKGIEEYYSYSTKELTELLKKHNNGYVKSRICTELGRRKELIPIFEELENMENQKMEALFGLSVAQILGLIIIDNGNRNDIEYLISKINRWKIKHQKEDFIYFLESNDIFIL
ncbi:MAG: hypothetical protein Q4B43_08760 [Bacteroidota bacterium]|nr:hypothetical protein [Bacteroidota bacterium]